MSDKTAEPARLGIEGTYLVQFVNEHTCGTGPGGHYGAHEPGCGTIPDVDLSTLPGWDRLVDELGRAAVQEYIREHDRPVIKINTSGEAKVLIDAFTKGIAGKERAAAVKALRDAAALLRRYWFPDSGTFTDPRDAETAYSPDRWLEVHADRIETTP